MNERYAMVPYSALFRRYDVRATGLRPAIAAMFDCGVTDRLFRRATPLDGVAEQAPAGEEPLRAGHFVLPAAFAAAGTALAAAALAAERVRGARRGADGGNGNKNVKDKGYEIGSIF